MNQFDYLLFDFGGVLVEWDGIGTLLALTGNRMTAEGARRFWLESKWVRLFEAGKCDEDAYARGVVDELGLDISPREFLREFETWDRGILPGALEMLKALSANHRLACLSNNNPIHWNVQRRLGLLDCFERLFASFETGFVKPDREAFAHVVAQLGAAPGRILFFDDNQECVSAAEEIGMVARRVIGVEGVKHALNEFGIDVDGQSK